MSTARFVLAVDGGGTKTAAALLAWDGTVLASCRTGPANLYRDPAAGLAAIDAGWRELCAAAGLAPEDAAPATLVSAGLAGVSGAAQRRAFAGAFAGFAGRRLSSDGYAAYVSVFGAAPGALLAVGTGVVAYRRPSAGDPLVVAGGWGFPAADRGSGAWLGLQLVADYLDLLDGAAAHPGSALWPAVADRVGREREAILAWLRDARAADFAAMAPTIVAAAAAGDPAATTLLAAAGGHVLRLARALAPTPEAPLALGGGMAEVHRPRLAAALGPALLTADRCLDPIHGAWLVAVGRVPPEFPDPAA